MHNNGYSIMAAWVKDVDGGLVSLIEMEYITVEEVKGCESSTWEVKAYPANGEKDKEKDKGSYVLFEKDTEEEAEKNRNSLFTNIPLGEIA